MATLNINRAVQDAFYRYKMPRLQVKVEGNGNGIKTVLTNIVEVAKSLSRPPAYPTKFFGCELGALVNMDEKTERYIVNGCHEQGKLQELLFTFIDKFVLCEGCGNPETSLKVTKRKTIEQNCVACGHHRSIPMIHKLTTYILTHPPSDVSDNTTKSSKVEKKGKEGSIDMPQASVRANAAERASGAVSAPAAAEDGDDDDVEWSEDVSEAAVRERQATLGSGVAALTMSADLERSIEDRLEMFHKFVQARAKQVPFPAKEVLGEAERLECKEKGVLSVAMTVLDDEALLAKIDAHKALLVQFTHDNNKSQKYLLGAIERVIESHQAALLPKVVAILKRLYDHDIVEEEAILSWGDKSSKKYVSKELNQRIRDAAAPFFKWLKEADEESEEDEEEEDEDGDADDVGIVYAGAATGVSVTKAQGNGAADLEADDDVDIDAL